MAQENVNLPVGQILELVKAAVAEAKKPSADEQAKIAEAKRLKEREREETLRIGQEAELRETTKQATCPHRKENGKPSTGGQVMNDGKALLLCLRCGKKVNIDFDNVTRSAIDRGDVSLEEMAFPA